MDQMSGQVTPTTLPTLAERPRLVCGGLLPGQCDTMAEAK